MKKNHCSLLGNSLMGLGLVLLATALLLLLLARLGVSALVAEQSDPLAVLLLFAGTFIWLIGAQISGHEALIDRYYMLRYRQHKQRHSHHR